jgi:outer membrane lipoprotein-sorting protein
VRPFLLIIVFLSLLSLGCLSKTRKVAPPPAALLDASLEDLLSEMRRLGSIRSMKATVDLQLSYLNDARTKETQLRDVRGFVLARRPDHIRVQAQVPVTGGRAFDMASDGSMFRVYLPWKGRFFEGDSQALRSEKRTENIRPQHVLAALLPDAPTADETPVLDRVTEGPRHFYVVQLLTDREGEGLRIHRKAWFDRTTLRMHRLEVRDSEDEVISLAQYRAWTEELGQVFPREVILTRPLEGYDLAVRFIKPGLNEDVPDDSFDLVAPPGIKIERVGEEQVPAETAASGR